MINLNEIIHRLKVTPNHKFSVEDLEVFSKYYVLNCIDLVEEYGAYLTSMFSYSKNKKETTETAIRLINDFGGKLKGFDSALKTNPDKIPEEIKSLTDSTRLFLDYVIGFIKYTFKELIITNKIERPHLIDLGKLYVFLSDARDLLELNPELNKFFSCEFINSKIEDVKELRDIQKTISKTFLIEKESRELENKENNTFNNVPIKTVRELFGVLTTKKNSLKPPTPFINEDELNDFIDCAFLGKKLKQKINIRFNNEKDIIRLKHLFYTFKQNSKNYESRRKKYKNEDYAKLFIDYFDTPLTLESFTNNLSKPPKQKDKILSE